MPQFQADAVSWFRRGEQNLARRVHVARCEAAHTWTNGGDPLRCLRHPGICPTWGYNANRPMSRQLNLRVTKPCIFLLWTPLVISTNNTKAHRIVGWKFIQTNNEFAEDFSVSKCPWTLTPRLTISTFTHICLITHAG